MDEMERRARKFQTISIRTGRLYFVVAMETVLSLGLAKLLEAGEVGNTNMMSIRKLHLGSLKVSASERERVGSDFRTQYCFHFGISKCFSEDQSASVGRLLGQRPRPISWQIDLKGPRSRSPVCSTNLSRMGIDL